MSGVHDPGESQGLADLRAPGVEAVSDETKCPVCGKDGVKACVDPRDPSRDLDFDHDGRPPFFPPGFDRIFPPADT